MSSPASIAQDEVTKNSSTIARWTLVSRATGFARVFAIAAVLGPTHFGNVFQLANQLPWVVYELAAGSLLASLIVPPLVRALANNPSQVVPLARGLLTVVVGLFSAVSLVTMLVAPFGLDLLGRSIEGVDLSDYRRVGLLLVLLTTPQLIGYGIIAVATSAQQAAGRFAFAAGVPAVENLIVIAVLGLHASTGQAGQEIGSITERSVWTLGLGSSAAVAVHTALQWWAASRAGIPLGFTKNVRTPEIRGVLRMGVDASATAALNGLRHLTLLGVTGTVAGGVVAYNVAISFLNLPIALGARPVATAQLPVLTTLATHRRRFNGELQRGIALASALIVPTGLAFAFTATSLAAAVAWGEMSSTYGRGLVAAAVGAVGFSVWGEGLYQLASHASYARSQPRPPLIAMAARALLVVIGAGVVVRASLSATTVVFTIIAIGSASDLIGGGIVQRLVAPGYFPTTSVLKIVALSIVTVGPAAIIAREASQRWPSPPGSTIAVGLACLLGVGLPALVGVHHNRGTS